MAQINKPDEYFNTVLWTGDGSSPRNITGIGFQPDWVWVKCRNAAVSHAVYDSVRGASNLLNTNSNSAEGTNPALNAFISDGFTVNSDSYVNLNSNTYVSWNWLASNTTASNTDGSITSTVSANTTSGFSIVSYTGTGANATIGHGLGTAPSMIIIKNRDEIQSWIVGITSNVFTWSSDYLRLNLNDAKRTDGGGTLFSSAPTSSLINVGSNTATNGSSDNMIAYCFAEKKGFSKFGSYTGNGNADGTFIYTGFKPAMIIIKGTAINTEWILSDNKRSTYNAVQNTLTVNTSDAEGTGTDRFDFFSNGFKLRNTGANFNTSGGTYIYMAFAENPLVGTNNIPATAR